MNLHDKVRGGNERPVPQPGVKQSRTAAGPCNPKLKIFAGRSLSAGVIPSFPARSCRSQNQGVSNHAGPAALGAPHATKGPAPLPPVSPGSARVAGTGWKRGFVFPVTSAAPAADVLLSMLAIVAPLPRRRCRPSQAPMPLKSCSCAH